MRPHRLLLVPLALLVASSSIAAQEPSADDVARWVEAFGRGRPIFHVEFRQHFWTRVHGSTRTTLGRLLVSRPGHLRFDYAEPSGKVVVCDDGAWTVYEPGEGGAAGQVAHFDAPADSTAALGILMGTAVLVRDFDSRILPRTSSHPPGSHALELRPRRPDPRYTRVIVFVQASGPARGAILRVSIEDPDGNWNRFDLVTSTFSFPTELPEDAFAFTPPAGTRDLSRER